MGHYSRNAEHFSEEELQELLDEVKRRWEENDPIIRKFVSEVHELRKEGKLLNRLHPLEELIVRIIAEFLKRLTIP